MKKVYYQLILLQKSPLRIGNGGNEVSDSDLMLDQREMPFIPGSSIAGVLREIYGKLIARISGVEEKELFGYIEGEKLYNSHVLVGDAVLPKNAKRDEIHTTVRNGIGIDEWGVAIQGHKYDFQVTETKIPYISLIEWSGDEAAYEKEVLKSLDPLMKHISAEGLLLGARTTRGFGSMEVTVRKKVYSFPQNLDLWLKDDLRKEGAFPDESTMQKEAFQNMTYQIRVKIKMMGSFSVRVYTARAEVLEDGSVPDSLPLKNADGKPVISGTTWAGVFRHHMQDVLHQAFRQDPKCVSVYKKVINRFFGMEETEGEHKRSPLRVSETEIIGGTAYSLTRNAVDRFTQAPRNTSLFTSQLWQGGEGELELFFSLDSFNDVHKKVLLQLLAITFIDLDLGILPFGGSTSTGQGRAEIETISVNGTDVKTRLKSQDCHFLEEWI